MSTTSPISTAHQVSGTASGTASPTIRGHGPSLPGG